MVIHVVETSKGMEFGYQEECQPPTWSPDMNERWVIKIGPVPKVDATTLAHKFIDLFEPEPKYL